MNYKFDVFISYKHAPLDQVVAGKLQKKMERYRISKDIQKKTGKKKINRVFRDAEELSVGHDLSDEIESQLKQTEFLVVVCSPSAKKSAWVDHEIETFLKYHPASNVLPLLIEGEPEEAFPNNLMSLGEPFAADIRADSNSRVLRKLDKEIDRIIAPVLHCSYDELKQRQKRYRMQRLATALGAVLVLTIAFACYVLRQNSRITSAYYQQLMSESQYLISEAEQLYDSGDSYGSIRKLVKALPSTETPRPLIPEAQYTLTQNLGFYNSSILAQQSLVSAGIITMKSGFNDDICVDSSGKYLMAHNYNHFYVYDAEKMILLHTFTSESSFMDFIPKINYDHDKGIIYLNDEYTVYCYNYKEDKIIWKKSNPNSIHFTLFSKDKKRLIILTDKTIFSMNIEDGSCGAKRTLSFSENEYMSINSSFYNESENAEVFAFTTKNYNSDDGNCYLYDKDFNLINKFHFTDSRNERSLLLMDAKTLLIDYYNSDNQMITLESLNVVDGKSIWKKEYATDNSDSMIQKCKNDSYYKNGYLYCHGSQMLILNGKTGNTYVQNDLESPVKNILQSETTSMFLTKLGDIFYDDYENNSLTKINLLPKNYISVTKVDGKWVFYILKTNETIAKYSIPKTDDNITAVSGFCTDSYNYTMLPYGESFMGYDSENFYYINKKNNLITFPYSGDFNIKESIINMEDGDPEIIYPETSEDNTTTYNYVTVNPKKRSISDKVCLYESDQYVSLSKCAYKNHIFATMKTDESNQVKIHTVDMSKEKEQDFSLYLEGDNNSDIGSILTLSPEADDILLADTNELYLYLIDRENQSIISKIDLVDYSRDFLNNITQDTKNDWLTWSPSEKYFSVSSNKKIYIYDKKGKLVQKISYTESNEDNSIPFCRFSKDDQNFFYFWDGQLYQYSINKEKIQEQITLNDEALDDITWQEGEGRLYVNADSNTYIIENDEDAFGLIAKISNSPASNAASQKILVSYSDEEGQHQFGIYKEYSLDDILKAAHEELEEEDDDE